MSMTLGCVWDNLNLLYSEFKWVEFIITCMCLIFLTIFIISNSSSILRVPSSSTWYLLILEKKQSQQQSQDFLSQQEQKNANIFLKLLPINMQNYLVLYSLWTLWRLISSCISWDKSSNIGFSIIFTDLPFLPFWTGFFTDLLLLTCLVGISFFLLPVGVGSSRYVLFDLGYLALLP
jgi:hypothetical protein